MRAARLRHRVTLQSLTHTYDTFNHPTKVWTDVETIWAAVEGISSKELIAAGSEAYQSGYRVIMRYSTDVSSIDNSWRVVWGTKYLAIKSIIDPGGRGRPNTVIELLCDEGLQDG